MLVWRVAIRNVSNQQELIIPVVNKSSNESPIHATQGVEIKRKSKVMVHLQPVGNKRKSKVKVHL